MNIIQNGEHVVIIDLIVHKQLNNTYGTILKWNKDKQRYNVNCHCNNTNVWIKQCNLFWVKNGEENPTIKDNTITIFIRSDIYNNDFVKLLEILVFPPNTIYNDVDYFNIEYQQRDIINYVVITIKKDYVERVFALAIKYNLNIVKGVPIIKVINGKQLKQLNTQSNLSYEFKPINSINKPLHLSCKDVDDYLILLDFNNIVDWIHYYFPNKNITTDMGYDGIMGFFNGRYCPRRNKFVSSILPDAFFITHL